MAQAFRLTAVLALLAQPAGALELTWPVDCTLGQSCHIQQYPDHDAGPGATDFTCGPLSYDGHDGTDIALATRAAMATGVNVLAAAPGTVRGIRDGVADFAPVVEGRECGNGVLIDHGDGWATQYCHLKRGSVRVNPGDTVAAGAVLGQIGQSGLAEFPHLHLSVRHNDTELDPFAPGAPTCGQTTPGLWAIPVPYEPGGILQAGFAANVPEFDAIRAGLPPADLPPTAPGLVLWVYLFGTRAGDELSLAITGPEGQVLSDTATFDRTQAQAFRAFGKRLTSPAWTAGSYTGTAILSRDGQVIEKMRVTTEIRP